MPAALIFLEAGGGQTTRRGRPFSSRIIVRVFDENSNWMQNEPVKFSLPPTVLEPSGRFPGGVFDNTALTDAVGRAVSEVIDADDLLGTWRGTVEAVSDPSIHADFYLTNEATPFVPSHVTITANANQTEAQFNAFHPVTGRLTDENGVGVAGEVLGMTCPPGSGTFPGGATSAGALTDGGGYATFPPFSASGAVGTHEYTVGYPALFPGHGFLTIVNVSETNQIAPVSGGGQVVPPGFFFPQPLVVQVTNASGTPLSGVFVSFNAITDAGGATLVWTAPAINPATATTDINGYATSPSFASNGVAGTYAVYASAPPAPQAGFQITDGVPPPPSLSVNALIICEV